MKNFRIFTALLLFFLFYSNNYGQEANYKNLVSGNFNINYNKSAIPSVIDDYFGSLYYYQGTEKSYSFAVDYNLMYGRQISGHWLLGIGLHHGYSEVYSEGFILNNINISSLTNSFQRYGIQLLGRYTFNQSNKLQFYLKPYAEYNFINQRLIYSDKNQYDSHTNLNFIEAGFKPGFLFNFNERFGISLDLGSTSIIYGKSEPLNNHSFYKFSSTTFQVNNLQLGVQYKF